jgi:hypothetical protein
MVFYERSEVLTAVRMALFFRVLTPCRIVGRYQRFGEIYCVLLQAKVERFV